MLMHKYTNNKLFYSDIKTKDGSGKGKLLMIKGFGYFFKMSTDLH